jgi:hypothetical protein
VILTLSVEQIAIGTGSLTAIGVGIGAFLGKQLTAFTLKRVESRHSSELALNT